MNRRRLMPWMLLTLLAGPALGQFESPLLSKVQLNLVNPGGKSLAMGGAFVSVADDATAAFSNPAGLTQLGSFQVGGSGKNFKFEPTLRTENFRESASGFDIASSQNEYRPSGNTSELEFVSVVAPLGGQFALAAYRAVNLRYSQDASDLVGGNYRAYSAFLLQPGGISSLDEQGGLDLRNELYGVSLAGKLGPVSVGAGVTLNKLRFDLTGGAAGGPHLFRANADDLRANVAFDTSVSSSVTSGTKAGFIVGVKADLWQERRVAVGVVYRKSPKFDIDYSVRAFGPALGTSTISFSCGVPDPRVVASGTSACGSFKVPDDFSIGISGMVLPNLLVAVEVQRILYSQLNDGYVPLFAYSAGTTRAISGGSSEDGTIPRIGVEYTAPFGSGTEVNFRVGYFREPAHGTKLQLYPDLNNDRRADPVSPIEFPPISQAYRTAFDGGVAENHVSFGVGASIARHLSIDLAADLSPSTKVVVLSAFYRF
ncbi:MAG: hypothetical protein ABIT01_09225 [Thermoanaerobaculia bacterium]